MSCAGNARKECVQTTCARSGPHGVTTFWGECPQGVYTGTIIRRRMCKTCVWNSRREAPQGTYARSGPMEGIRKTCGERHCMVHAANARRDCVQAVFPSMLRRECVQGMCPENVRKERPHGVPAEIFTHREWAAQRTCAQSVAKRHAQGLCVKHMIAHSNKQCAHT